MKRRNLMIGGLGVAAAAAGVGGALWQSRRRAEEALDATFWSQRFERPEGGELVVASLRGHPVLLNFWATWCAPCVTEMPLLDRFHAEHSVRGWKVVGLAVDSPTPVREFLLRRKVGFAVGLAGLDGVELARSLGNESGALPYSVLFDASGKVVARKLGALHPPDLAAWAGLLG